MYHFFVTGKKGAWDQGFYLFDRARFLEYTNNQIAKAFPVLTDARIKTLLSWPCLFAYEGEECDFRVGTLNSIKEQGRSIRIEFTLSPDIRPIPNGKIKEVAPLLDIRDWEMNRTHWAIKDEDLFQRLRERKLIAPIDPAHPAREQESVDQLPDTPPPATVSTVGEFIQIVLDLQADGKEVFYRGHSDKERYKLEPSLFRKDTSGNYRYLDAEHTL
jgi:hypothetical protein